MNVLCTDKKIFHLVENETNLGTLTYLNWHSYQANIEIAGEKYELKAKSIFSSQILILKNETEIGHLKLHYDGKLSIIFNDNETFEFKTKGWSINKYLIENAKKEPQFLLAPEFNWKQFAYNYEITLLKEYNPLLILLGIYAGNYFIGIFAIYLFIFVIILI